MAGSAILARNLARFRAERGITMGQLAAEAGLSKQTVSAIEAGRGNPTIDTLETLADTLGVSLRALVSEMGNEVLVHRGESALWEREGPMHVQRLDQAYGSGYVFNVVLRLDASQPISRHKAAGRASLRHCYVLDGLVRLGPESAPVVVAASDFVRFPADGPHLFESISPVSRVLVCTTAPQLSMGGGDRVF